MKQIWEKSYVSGTSHSSTKTETRKCDVGSASAILRSTISQILNSIPPNEMYGIFYYSPAPAQNRGDTMHNDTRANHPVGDAPTSTGAHPANSQHHGGGRSARSSRSWASWWGVMSLRPTDCTKSTKSMRRKWKTRNAA